MIPITWIFLAVLFACLLGFSLYLLTLDPIQGPNVSRASPWVFFVARLSLIAAMLFSLLVMNSVRVFIPALGAFLISIITELARRRKMPPDSRR